MKYRLLGVLPLVGALAFVAAGLLAGSGLQTVLDVENEVGKLVGFAGCMMAAFAFERGDYLRRAWATYGACYVCLLLNDTLKRMSGGELVLARGLVVLLGNGALVFGAAMLARAWTVSGLEDDETAARHKRTMFGIAVLVVGGIGGWAVWHDTRAILGGDNGALVNFASDLGDCLVLLMVVPVAQTAIAMRGGLLLWPWGFMTLGGLWWAAYDTSSDVVDALHLGGGPLVASEALRVMASGYVCAAGIAQRWTVAPEAAASTRR